MERFKATGTTIKTSRLLPTAALPSKNQNAAPLYHTSCTLPPTQNCNSVGHITRELRCPHFYKVTGLLSPEDAAQRSISSSSSRFPPFHVLAEAGGPSTCRLRELGRAKERLSSRYTKFVSSRAQKTAPQYSLDVIVSPILDLLEHIPLA